MDQNENKNLEQRVEEATEVKRRQLKQQRNSWRRKEEANSCWRSKRSKAPDADGDFKEAIEKRKKKWRGYEKAKKKLLCYKEKIEEAASKVFTGRK